MGSSWALLNTYIMKQILESMLAELEWLSTNASNWEYYLGKYDLCKELLDKCDEDDDYPCDIINEF